MSKETKKKTQAKKEVEQSKKTEQVKRKKKFNWGQLVMRSIIYVLVLGCFVCLVIIDTDTESGITNLEAEETTEVKAAEDPIEIDSGDIDEMVEESMTIQGAYKAMEGITED